MKRVLAFMLVIAMACCLFVGCEKPADTGEAGDGNVSDSGSGTEDSNETSSSGDKEVEEVYWFSSIGAYKTLLEREVAKWNDTVGAEKGIRIVMETNIDNYSTAAQTMMEAGTFPDLFDGYGRSNWINAGWIKNLYEVEGLEDLVARFEPYLAQGVNLDGDMLVAFPLEIVPIKMVYNKEIFDECGLDGAPKTWDEMVEYAKIITEKGNYDYYGFGWTTMFSIAWRRQAFKATMSSTGVGYFDNTNAKYDFKPFKPVVDAVTQMYQEGAMFPSPLDQHIDPIRNRFAEGLVGMEIAPAYDISVYNTQFPCNFEWRVADVPAYEPGGLPYKGVSLNRANVSISSAVSDDRMWAVVEVMKFLHSEELYKKLHSNSAIIPHEASIIEAVKAEGYEMELKNWADMADITNYTYVNPMPDGLLTIEGDSFETVFTNIMLGETTWEAEIDALNERYNTAYQQAKEDGLIDPEIYEQPYSLEK